LSEMESNQATKFARYKAVGIGYKERNQQIIF